VTILSYTTALSVRKALPTLLIDEDYLGTLESGTFLELHNPARAVPTLYQDDEELTLDVDYTFKRPTTITLTSSADGENYIALCYYAISDADLDIIIGRADNIIDTYFMYLSKPGETYLADISTWLSASIYLKEYATATEENMTRADALYKLAMDTMETLKDNFTGGSVTNGSSYVRVVNG
jgi:hypothetical protein